MNNREMQTILAGKQPELRRHRLERVTVSG
jgi:hypothetical protein